MKIATVFSGIGAPEYTIKSFFRELDPEIVFACDCGETKRGLTKEEIGEIKRAPVEERQALTKKIYEKLRSRHWIKETYFKNFADFCKEPSADAQTYVKMLLLDKTSCFSM
jgi:hypothetical protein